LDFEKRGLSCNIVFMKEYELTVGLEVHAELKTQTKMFCACKNDPDEKEPNVNVCTICMGHPGTLPTLNKEAIKSVIKVGRAIGGKIADFTEWDRKNYFYPDIPKGYQISQYKYPLVSGGELAGVKITRIHLEEDTGTSQHDKGDFSILNYNRAGVPLMELVTEPVIKSARQAGSFAEELQLLLRTLGVAEANMEKGEMRVEANISVAPKSQTDADLTQTDADGNPIKKKLGTKVEVKNLNSFKAAEKSIEYEMKRHIEAYEKGETIVQETRGFDENTGTTFSQRKKEDSHDYRYFPEPDLPKLYVSQIPEFSVEALKAEIPELPWEKRERYGKEFGLNQSDGGLGGRTGTPVLGIKNEDIEMFVRDFALGEFFENVIKDFGGDKNKVVLASNYVTSDVVGLSRKENISIDEVVAKIPHANFAELINLVSDKKISSRGAKDILAIMYKDGGEPLEIAEKNGFILSNDPDALKKVIEQILAENPTVVSDYKAGKTNLIQFLVGQGMKAMKGSGDPAVIKEELEKLLN
jgi:aspartyl-tRNA(Asn)/glutamyl-tRNA(Gln) amidotransferase subunit B